MTWLDSPKTCPISFIVQNSSLMVPLFLIDLDAQLGSDALNVFPGEKPPATEPAGFRHLPARQQVDNAVRGTAQDARNVAKQVSIVSVHHACMYAPERDSSHEKKNSLVETWAGRDEE
jgi:hypothetical protein